MADNVAITAGTGTNIAADDIGGVKFQRIKVGLGADGTANDAVAGAGAVDTGTQRVTLASNDPAVVDLAAIEVLLTTQAGYLDGLEAKLDTLITSAGTELPAGNEMIGHVGGTEYETVAASQTAQVIGASGATGDYIAGILVIPATTSPGSVLLLDNATSITVFTGGASSVSNLVPFYIPLGAKSVSGAWKITTGANVSVIAFGDFT